ncbi:methionyl-tRNA formyltransferase [Iocasia frigidifontis]|uniref:Methionyl-tRNA formyltransferase n=1 Tax=Iocasia fonsfrigidae TaxID=2682810 RepID=A0A8A7KF87_9FIRM|nr:methionyl-tRNA formyltransferase [Iocasia fonsfrigidae]QTL98149.1 methionyl-tRNA formyltransferase [Iocasia fonsfrigidae]
MKVIFMGTPDFAVYSLEKLAGDQEIKIKGVVTQPDRKKGRGMKLQSSPVKKTALKLGLNLLQTDNVNSPNFIAELKELEPDIIVVVAFGQKLSSEFLAIPSCGCVNLHASLLPQYRGSSPINKVIIDGNTITGVSTMYMDEGWDTGDIIYKKEVPIEKADTAGTLHDKLAVAGADLLLKTILDIAKRTAPREKQDDSLASFAYKLVKSDGEIDWSKEAKSVYNHVRGMNPWPGAFTHYQGELIKIWQVSIVEDNKYINNDKSVGEILVADEQNGLLVMTGKGLISLEKIQLAGKQRMLVEEFLRGYDLLPGSKFK